MRVVAELFQPLDRADMTSPAVVVPPAQTIVTFTRSPVPSTVTTTLSTNARSYLRCPDAPRLITPGARVPGQAYSSTGSRTVAA
ncbi:hypothetical protein [Streptomyces cadmiisoli]|uniref:Uncharacterized protein n=1 Tax=Streptomyces cadmiisoli TaxID=2184053 RepID=A0A2Z4JCB6_9ACTN|nr:hypothetical protein [Streptomyces cadmiisoli]AWW42003.1 hypothetical protein DN051_39805 [Streptomyces cadmiisoli]